MARHKAPLPQAAEPRYGSQFDPWNSSATGHQRPETRGPAGWRDSRNVKLHSQLRAGNSGGERLSDLVGAGSEDFDERPRVLVPRGARARAMGNSVVDMLRRPGSMRPGSSGDEGSGREGVRAEEGNLSPPIHTIDTLGAGPPITRPEGDSNEVANQVATEVSSGSRAQAVRKIFDGLVIYVNGSVFPLMSDHKLKHVLAENGALVSLHLGRRQVTHVILGRPNGARGGAGGGLAGGKLEKEIRRVGGCGVRYVGVEWVLESIKHGRRLPEARFGDLKIAAKGQQRVFDGSFSTATTSRNALAGGPAAGERAHRC